MKKDEMCRENNARRVSQTHNNKRDAFGTSSFTSTGMTFLTVTCKNVSFTLGKVTLLGPTGHAHA